MKTLFLKKKTELDFYFSITELHSIFCSGNLITMGHNDRKKCLPCCQTKFLALSLELEPNETKRPDAAFFFPGVEFHLVLHFKTPLFMQKNHLEIKHLLSWRGSRILEEGVRWHPQVLGNAISAILKRMKVSLF